MVKLDFQQALCQSSMSHDPSEIIIYPDLVLKKHFLLLSMLFSRLFNEYIFKFL